MSIIYLDNAATTFLKPKQALKKTIHFLRKGYGNAGRSGHLLSMNTAEMIYNTRVMVARQLNFSKPDGIVFYHNATEALNVAIKTCIPKGANVLTSYLEHNSVLRPLYSLQSVGDISISHFSHKGNVGANIENAIKANTKAIVCTLVSNVTGEEIDLSILSELKRKYNLTVIVDATQLFCHKKIDLTKNTVDILCSAGHKGAFGMQGVAFSAFNFTPEHTYLEGGSGSETFSREMPKTMPDKMEAGTLSAPAIVSLYYGLEFVEEYGIDNISKRLLYFDNLINEAIRRNSKIKQLFPGKHGIHAFLLNNEISSTTARKFEQHNILLRGGYHCAPLVHKFYKTESTGAVRASLSVLNTEKEVKFFLNKIMRA